MTECPEGKFRCRDMFCLPERLTCNGENDCGDNSDELKVCGNYKTDYIYIIHDSGKKLK